MHVLIPAGGRGVRLRPLTFECPKPLLPLGDRPILTRIVEGIPSGWPVTVLVTPDLERDFREWKSTLPSRYDVRVFVERARESGRGGPVVALADCVNELRLHDDLVILMGDSVLPFTLEEFLVESGIAGKSLSLAAYRVPSLDDARRFGVVEIGPQDTAVTFEEKPAEPRSQWVYTGCLHIPSQFLDTLASVAEGSLPQMGHLVGRYLEQGHPVHVHRATGLWHDIGTFASYLEAHRALIPAEQNTALKSQGNSVEGVVWVHPSATVSRSRLSNCIVSDSAQIVNAELSDCIVQPRVSVLDRQVHGKLITLGTEHALNQAAVASH